MAQTIEIPFSEVRPGEIFLSKKTKRSLYGIKMQETFFTNVQGFSLEMNAVILAEGTGHRSDDAGHIIYFDVDEIVEVARTLDGREHNAR